MCSAKFKLTLPQGHIDEVQGDYDRDDRDNSGSDDDGSGNHDGDPYPPPPPGGPPAGPLGGHPGGPPGGPPGVNHGGNQPPQFPNLAQAITLLAGNLQQPARNDDKTKIHVPDPFDGTDLKKLQPFLVQLQLAFRDQPNAFRDDTKKVNFTLSYLRGLALDNFEPALMDPYAIVEWADDYSTFVGHVRDNFSPFNMEADAENKLEKLRMKENHKIAKYIVNFNQLAPRVQWGKAALRRAFYMGLPSRIKDEIAQIGKPDMLMALRNVSQSIDARYWERHGEISRETATSSKPDKGADKKTGKQSDKKSNSGNNNSASGSRNRNSTPTPRANAVTSGLNSNSNNRKTTPDLSDKLRKDSKLTQAE
jgi:Retrotransposon gag protein